MRTGYFIGVDVHKNVCQVCVFDASGRVVAEKRFRYSRSPRTPSRPMAFMQHGSDRR